METVKTIIFGSGKATGDIARELLQSGGGVVVATRRPEVDFEPAGVEVLTEATLHKVENTPPGYHLTFAREADSIRLHADRLVLCDDYQRVAAFSLYDLIESDSVIALSQLVADPETYSGKDGSIVFLTGIFRESNALVLSEIMESARRLARDHARKVYILTGNLKVAARGLEALYREIRQAGVTLVKFNREKPSIQQMDTGKTTMTFKDEITGLHFRLTPDLTVVDEIVSPSMETMDTANMLGIDQAPDGFAQADNVHRLPTLTNHRGILAAGPSRAVLDHEQQAMDLGSVALACRTVETSPAVSEAVHAEIDRGQCVRCLTCFRLCPFGAVVLDNRVQVAPSLCEGCGICRAECPKEAINLRHLEFGTPAQQMDGFPEMETTDGFQPRIIAFCCSRSAVPAAALAGCLGHNPPAGLTIVQVPCSGAISTNDLLYAFQNRADGIAVLTCHAGNCHAEKGNHYARQRVAEGMDILSRVGLPKERLLKSTLAANMGPEFIDIMDNFYNTLKGMGPAFNHRPSNG